MVELDFRHLVQQHKSTIYSTCLGFVHSHEDAEDLAQEVFVEAYRKWQQFRHDASVGTWLYRIAVNKSLTFLRSQKAMKRQHEAVDVSEVQVTNFEHPGVLLENQEQVNLLMGHIRNLPEQQQTALILSKIEGLSYEEIGQVMNKSLSSVESLLHRAKKQLRKTLNQHHVQS